MGEDRGPPRPMPSGQHLRLVPRCRSSWLPRLPRAPGSISSLGGGEDRGRFAGNRRQRGVIKIPNAVCGACYRPTILTAQPRCPRPSSPSLAPRPNATRDEDSRLPKPTGRGSGRGPTVSEGRWSCVQLGGPGAVCCLRTGSQYSCSASARRLPPSRRMHPRAGGDRSPPQSPGRCRGLAVSHRLD